MVVHEVAATIFQCSPIKSVPVSTEIQAAFVIGLEKIFSVLTRAFTTGDDRTQSRVKRKNFFKNADATVSLFDIFPLWDIRISKTIVLVWIKVFNVFGVISSRLIFFQCLMRNSKAWDTRPGPVSVIWDFICRLKISLSDGIWAYFLLLKISFKSLAIACNFFFWSTVKSKIFSVSTFSVIGL